MQGTLRHLLLVDARRRFINNTPYDVYKLAARLDRADVIDLRFHDGEELPDADAAYLFLETAGTWMCFDWAPDRFIRRLRSVLARYPRVTVVGPQARALRQLTGERFEIVDRVDFAAPILGGTPEEPTAIPSPWLDPDRNRDYNGQWFAGAQLELAPTFSVCHTMSCPLRCSFCFYADSPRQPKPAFEATLADVERIWRHGHRNFYFMDPNFLRSSDELDRLQELHERTHGELTYYCQISPNFLTEARLRRLAASGCRGMVVGIENRARIAAKGSIGEAAERVARVRALGMMPMLFFMIDAENEVEEVIDDFRGTPFRYTVLNDAFAGDRSLRSIEHGFAEKRRLSARRSEVIARLEERPEYFGALAGSPPGRVLAEGVR